VAWVADNNFIRRLVFNLGNAFGQSNTFLRALPGMIFRFNSLQATELDPLPRLLIYEYINFTSSYCSNYRLPIIPG